MTKNKDFQYVLDENTTMHQMVLEISPLLDSIYLKAKRDGEEDVCHKIDDINKKLREGTKIADRIIKKIIFANLDNDKENKNEEN